MKNDNVLKRIWKVFHSMKLGIILLTIIALVSVIGTLIPQGYSEQFYISNYPAMGHEMILLFGLDHVFSTWWYIILNLALLINLILCSINRFKPIFYRVKNDPDLEQKIKASEFKIIDTKDTSIDDLAKKLSISSLKEKEIDGKKVRYAFTNKIGYLGSWLTHLSIIIIMVAFAYGRYQGFEEFIYGLPGMVLEVENSDKSVRIDDFDILFRNDFTVEQYITDLTVMDGDKELETGRTMVNNPYRTDDFNIYQNSTGWAVEAILYKNDKYYKHKVLYKNEFFVEDDDKIALQFVDFYPDLDESNPMMPRTKSPFPNHPVMLYAIYYDGVRVDMGLCHMGEQIEYEEYAFLVQNPQMFTLLQLTHDPGKTMALVGGILMMLGLFLAFYVNPKELIIIDTDEENIKKLYVRQSKKDKIFENKIEEILNQMEVK